MENNTTSNWNLIHATKIIRHILDSKEPTEWHELNYAEFFYLIGDIYEHYMAYLDKALEYYILSLDISSTIGTKE